MLWFMIIDKIRSSRFFFSTKIYRVVLLGIWVFDGVILKQIAREVLYKWMKVLWTMVLNHILKPKNPNIGKLTNSFAKRRM